MKGYIEKLAKPHAANRPYHNWQHELNVVDRALSLADRCRKYGFVAKEEVIVWVGCFHDCHYGEDPRKFGFSTPEQLSDFVLRKVMRENGCSEELISECSQALLPTDAKVMPHTLEAKIIRAADLAGLAAPYNKYRDDFERLMTEFNFTSEWDFFWPNLRALAEYLWPEIRLTQLYWNGSGSSWWHEKAVSNIVHNYHEICAVRGEEPLTIVEIGPGCLPVSLTRHNPKELIIGIEPDERSRRHGVRLSLHVSKLTSGPIELVIPGQAMAIPVPDHVVSEIMLVNVALRHPEAINQREFERILKPGGSLDVYENYSPEPWMNGGTSIQSIEGLLSSFDRFSLRRVSRVSEENINPDGVDDESFCLTLEPKE